MIWTSTSFEKFAKPKEMKENDSSYTTNNVAVDVFGPKIIVWAEYRIILGPEGLATRIPWIV